MPPTDYRLVTFEKTRDGGDPFYITSSVVFFYIVQIDGDVRRMVVDLDCDAEGNYRRNSLFDGEVKWIDLVLGHVKIKSCERKLTTNRNKIAVTRRGRTIAVPVMIDLRR